MHAILDAMASTAIGRLQQITASKPLRNPEEDAGYLVSQVVGPAAISLLGDGKLDTLALGQTDPWLLRANDEDVAFPSGELVVDSVLDVNNVETSVVPLTVSDDTNTTHVTTTSSHGDDTSVEADEVGDLASRQVNLDGVVNLDRGIGVTDPKNIVSASRPDL